MMSTDFTPLIVFIDSFSASMELFKSLTSIASVIYAVSSSGVSWLIEMILPCLSYTIFNIWESIPFSSLVLITKIGVF